MKKVHCYIPNVLLTVLLVFVLLATELVFFARMQIINTDTFRTVVQQEKLADKAYASLETYFSTRSNSTGIPAEVYLNAIGREELNEAIIDSVSQAFDYLSGKTDSYEFKMDFTELEGSITAFFEEYADENGYEKDEKYEKKLASTIKSAESKIRSSADTFKLSMMYEKGWLKTARYYLRYLNLASMISIVAVVVLLFLLILCNVKQIGHFFYWIGLSSLVAGALLLTPCVYVKATNFFAGFTIKDPQIFSAVVGLLNLLTTRATTVAIVTLVAALILLVAFIFICGLRWEDEEVEERLAGKPKQNTPAKKQEEPEVTEETPEEAEATEETSEEAEVTEETTEEPEVIEETTEEAEVTEETPEESEVTEEKSEETEVTEEKSEESEVTEEKSEEAEVTEEKSEEAEVTEETSEEAEVTEEKSEEPEVTEEKSEESK